jgi:PIN domain nuclease of toxin-antitoxin system
LTLRFLLDTHIIVWWLYEPRKLSREQARILREAERFANPAAISTTSLVEIATMVAERRQRLHARMEDIFEQLETNPIFRILPITIPIAQDTGDLSILRDPADRTIVATARVHRLRLLTSDRRIIDSKLVSVID